ncbi:uncharacterized protein LOC131651251 [Vicia villosa]|uniref:uncharacterized protein LOC131651251 n=1 Tax=Vicia villosa TaxID=3911 RepID=UPI00273B2F8A|nr:uncharacterized protein LOC131651251 [Vicia villosa]
MQSKEVVEKCDLAISKWFIDASIPFNVANSPYFQPAVDALCCMGAGYKVPTMHALRGNLINKWVDDVKIQIEQYRSIWKDTGCTLMADGWTDRCRRTLINFLVYCPKGTVFIKSVDASGASKTADTLFKLFKEVVLYVCQENVVQIITDNAANYVAAGKLLEREFPKLFWSPCAAHCINLMLQDMGKLEEVSEAVTKKKQNYDPINFETLGDHSNWVLEDSPPFLTIEEVEALRKDLASMTIQPISNDIDELNLDELDVEGNAPLNSEENNQSNDIIDGEDVANAIDFVGDGFDIEGDPNIEIILPPWN